MTASSSTARAPSGATVNDHLHDGRLTEIHARILAYWNAQDQTSVVQALKQFPSLVESRTLLLDLVVDEYRSYRHRNPSLDVRSFCQRFSFLGEALEQSIVRAVEVENYLDQHPELLPLVSDFDWPEPGETLQRFQVVEELGRGALGRVYLCHETDLAHREVVVKVTCGGEYEASLIARLGHPNIVPVYSVTHDPERLATLICMPYRGRSTLQDITDYIQQHGVPDDDQLFRDVAIRDPAMGRVRTQGRWQRCRRNFENAVLKIAVDLCDALAHSHALGIYHGDLKPSNVLLAADGSPLLIDFNLGKELHSNSRPCGGTLPYMSPEQLTEIAADIPSASAIYDARSEIYAFGALLFQLLTGKVPFEVPLDGANPVEASQRIIAQQRDNLPSVRTANPSANAALERLIQECLAIQPDSRPQSMADVKRRLQAQLWPIARIRRAARKRPRASGFAALTLLLSVACGLVTFMTRPSYVASQFAHGVELQLAQDYVQALECFDRILKSTPEHRDAQFERARTRLLSGDLSAALVEFSRLAVTSHDPQSAAYVGYCFNLRQEHAAAVQWYEKALHDGISTAGLHNNLGISYAADRSMIQVDRFTKAREHLQRALELDPAERIIRANLVTLALENSELGSSHPLAFAVEHLEHLQAAAGDDPRVLSDAVWLYGILSLIDEEYVSKCLTAIEHSLQLQGRPSAEELLSSPKFEAVRRDPGFERLYLMSRRTTVHPRPSNILKYMDPAGTQ